MREWNPWNIFYASAPPMDQKYHFWYLCATTVAGIITPTNGNPAIRGIEYNGPLVSKGAEAVSTPTHMHTRTNSALSIDTPHDHISGDRRNSLSGLHCSNMVRRSEFQVWEVNQNGSVSLQHSASHTMLYAHNVLRVALNRINLQQVVQKPFSLLKQ